jgi:hypothetical protein
VQFVVQAFVHRQHVGYLGAGRFVGAREFIVRRHDRGIRLIVG